MKFLGIEKVNEGRFITRFDVKYQTESGNIKNYEMVSRNKDLCSPEELRDGKTDAVVLIIHDRNKEKILLNREFRMAVCNYAFNFPAGLIDPGEDTETAAKRELKEETGLDLISIEQEWPSSYSAIGLTNERSIVIIGTAEGKFSKSTSDEEEIEASWYTKDEIRELLKGTDFAARTQAYCLLWANS